MVSSHKKKLYLMEKTMNIRKDKTLPRQSEFKELAFMYNNEVNSSEDLDTFSL